MHILLPPLEKLGPDQYWVLEAVKLLFMLLFPLNYITAVAF